MVGGVCVVIRPKVRCGGACVGWEFVLIMNLGGRGSEGGGGRARAGKGGWPGKGSDAFSPSPPLAL